MTSLAYTDGFYYVPRIDKQIVLQFKDDLIVLTGNMYGEVPSKILNVGEAQAEEALLWWQQQFGNDLYIELMRHGQEDEDRSKYGSYPMVLKNTVFHSLRPTTPIMLKRRKPTPTIFYSVLKKEKNKPLR